MASIPQQEEGSFVKTLFTWFEKKTQLAKLRAEESLLRDAVFKHYFKSPKEGVNRIDLGETIPESRGYDLKLEFSYDRKIDEQQLTALRALKVKDMLEQLKNLGFPVDSYAPDDLVVDALKLPLDKLIRYKPELVTKEWRTLTEEQHKIFDRILEIKPASPQLNIEMNKVGKAAAEAAAAPKGPEDQAPAPAQDNPPLEIPVFTSGAKAPF